MSTPHICPNCKGNRGFKTVEYPEKIAYRDVWKTCPTCCGEGVVWDHGDQCPVNYELKAGDVMRKVH